MKIECILKRAGGTQIVLGKTSYHFKPDDQDRHVANVEDADHIEILLRIPEGYQPLDPLPQRKVSIDDALAALKEQFPGADLSAFLSSTAPAPTPAASATTVTTDAAQPVTEDADADDETDSDDNGLSDLTDDEIRAEFEKLLGRKPHHNARRDTMEAQIVEALKSGVE